MAGFVNPFASMGRADVPAAEACSDSLFSLSYLVGNPNPQTLSEPQQVLIFKSLMRRDPKTKEKALNELLSLLNNKKHEPTFVDDNLHRSWIQLYWKLSIDVSSSVRKLSHDVLAAMYGILGKRSSKYLADSVGPWLAGTHDPDAVVSSAAAISLNTIFPGDRKMRLLEKFVPNLVSYISEALASTAGTISDERFVSAEDAKLKYARALKDAIDMLSIDLLSQPAVCGDCDLQTILSNKRLWKLTSYDTPLLSQSVISLATKHAGQLGPQNEMIWFSLIKALVKVAPQIFMDLLACLTVYTRRFPSNWKKSDVDMLLQSVSRFPLSSSSVWKLFYNLVMLIPENAGIQTTDTLSSMVTQLSKVVPRAVGSAVLSAWGCYLTICLKSDNSELIIRAMKSVYSYLENVNPQEALIEAMAVKFRDFSKYSGASEVVDVQLWQLAKAQDSKNAYPDVIALSGAYTDSLVSFLEECSLKRLAGLVKYRPELPLDFDLVKRKVVPGNVSNSADDLIFVASHSLSPQLSPQIVDYLLAHLDTVTPILRDAKLLSERGVFLDLTDSIENSDLKLLAAAVGAHGIFVTEEAACNGLIRLAEAAIDKDGTALSLLNDLALADGQYVSQTLGHGTLSKPLSSLKDTAKSYRGINALLAGMQSTDTVDAVVRDLQKSLDELTHDIGDHIDRATEVSKRADDKQVAALLMSDRAWLERTALLVEPASRCIYSFRWKLPPFTYDSKIWSKVLYTAVFILNVVKRDGQLLSRLSIADKENVLVGLLLVVSAAKGHQFTSLYKETNELMRAFIMEAELFLRPCVHDLKKKLWDSVEDTDEIVAFHAAQCLATELQTDKPPSSEMVEKLARDSRTSFERPGIKGALLVQTCGLAGTSWYDRYEASIYRDLDEDIQRLPLEELFLVDTRLDPERVVTAITSQGGKLKDEHLVECLWLIGAARQKLSTETDLIRTALSSDKIATYAVLKVLELGVDVDLLAKASLSLTRVESEFDLSLTSLFLVQSEFVYHQHQNISLELAGSSFEKLVLPAPVSWVFFCFLEPKTVHDYRIQLFSSDFESVGLPTELETLLSRCQRTGSDDFVPVALLFLRCVSCYSTAIISARQKMPSSADVFKRYEDEFERILALVTATVDDGLLNNFEGIAADELIIGDPQSALVQIFYLVCLCMSSSVRLWYRGITDRSAIKKIDQLLSSCVLPAIMRTITKTLKAQREQGVMEEATVFEQAREIRALVEVDEQPVSVVISLPDLYPVKPSSVQIKGLSVPESKKRMWILEAEHTVQNGSIVGAMKTLLLRLNNFVKDIEPCAICYGVVLEKSLPTKVCGTCHNAYHSDCLYRWLKSNGSRNCPMCRAKM